jgi:biotin carboxyl carrier protein
MMFDEIEALVRRLDSEGADRFEGEIGGARIRLIFESESAPISAPMPGRFRSIHPSQQDRYAAEGARIEAGDIVAFLEIGPILLPVRAPESCVIGRALAAEGDPVEYGQALFEAMRTGGG